MKVAVGAPVAERAWILPQWFECLRNQTLPIDNFCFVYSDSEDATWDTLHEQGAFASQVLVRHTKLPYHSRLQRNGNSKDPWRAKHMAQLRNFLRREFMNTDADVFISLDTDILLEDPTTLEQLVRTMQPKNVSGWRWDAAAPITYLHPLGAQSECYNAAILDGGEGFTQGWHRPSATEVLVSLPPLPIDGPFAAFAIRRHAMGMCRYRAHESGEDIGFAQSLKAQGFRVGWRTDLEVRHVWDVSYA